MVELWNRGYTRRLEAMKDFFAIFFEVKANDGYYNPKTGIKTYFLTCENGARLEIMSRPNIVDSKKELLKTGDNYLAFSVGSN